jgi:hypothetical protein
MNSGNLGDPVHVLEMSESLQKGSEGGFFGKGMKILTR